MFIRTGLGTGINPANAALDREVQLFRRAIRTTSATINPATGLPGSVPSGQVEDSHQPFDVSAIGDNVVVQGAQGSTIEIYSILLYIAGDACTVKLKDGADDLMGPLVGVAQSMGLLLPLQDKPYFKLHAGRPFSLNISNAGPAPQLTGFVKFRMVG